jgi:hypothetical protein
MKEYICKICNKIFNKKSHYDDHLKRKTSCMRNKDTKIIKKMTAENNFLTTENLKLTENDTKKMAENRILTEFDLGLTEKVSVKRAENRILTEFDLGLTEKVSVKRAENMNLTKFGLGMTEKNAEFVKSTSNIINSRLQINGEIIGLYLENNQCGYCQKKFSRKNNVTQHIKNYCKIKKEIEKHKEEIFENLKKEEIEKNNIIIKLEELENKMKNEFANKIKKELEIKEKELKKNLENEIKLLKNKIKEQSKIINNDNSINDNSQHLYLVGYNKEDLSRLDEKKVIENLHKGYQAPVEMTRLIHFDEKHPEYHNVYIPKINEKYGMVFKNDIWKLMDKNDLVDDIYESKRSYIVENLEKFIKNIDPRRLKSLQRFLNSEDNEISIINTKEEIKKLLYENRKMVMEHKNEVENINKKRKKLNVIVKK